MLTYFEVDTLKVLDRRIRKMVLVFIGVQKNGYEEHIEFGKAYSWTDFKVKSSDF